MTSASVWDRVIGQPAAVAELRQAAAAGHGQGPAHAMTHAWLITGPPGSGRTTAAVALAAGLICPTGGCGNCAECLAVTGDNHPDLDVVRSTTLSLGKDQTKALVTKSYGAPVSGGWRVFIIEDADRMTEAAANTLLKAIEEPVAGTVWLLCAPSTEDLLPTIRSRTRHIALRVPAAADVTGLLESEGVDPAMASFAAHAAQGHVGRARALATDEATRNRRAEILRIPRQLSTITDAFQAAADLKRTAESDAKSRTQQLDEAESAELLEVHGAGATGVKDAKIRSIAKRAMADLAKTQQQRSSRSVRDELDRYFLDLMSFYRGVLMQQLGASVEPVNVDMATVIDQLAQGDDLTNTMLRIDALAAARDQLASNVPPLLVCEALMVQLLHPVRPSSGPTTN